MVAISPGKGRADVTYRGGAIVVTIRSRRNPLILLFLGFWLIGWCFGEVFAASTLLTGKAGESVLFLLAWLGGWTLGGALAIYTWLWNAAGREIVSLDAMTLKHERKLPIFSRSKEYQVAHVRNLRVEPMSSSGFGQMRGLEFWGIAGGRIAFDYGRSTHRFGIALDDADAAYVVTQLSRHNTAIALPNP